DMGFVTGTGDRYAGGVTASTGTSKTAVRNTNARADGKIGGTGTGPARPPAPPPVDRSRSPRPESMSWESCGFPAEAEMEQIDHAVATIVATVGSDGVAKSVTVVSDPGFGFGRLAKSCAMRRRWIPGLDAHGRPVTKTSPPVRIRFSRN